MDKNCARRIARENLLKMTDEQKEWASGAICDALSGIDEYTRAHKVFVYLGTNNEPDTEEIVGLALMLEKVVCVPRVRGENMDSVVISPFTNFKRNKWGILEPVGCHVIDDVDVCVLPLVAFDGLKRAGHGKGYYDRYLATHDCYKIGLAFDCQNVVGLETDKYDIPLDCIVTQSRIITIDGERKNVYGDNL